LHKRISDSYSNLPQLIFFRKAMFCNASVISALLSVASFLLLQTLTQPGNKKAFHYNQV